MAFALLVFASGRVQSAPAIAIKLEASCYTPGCGPNWSQQATGIVSAVQCPAFCYRITVTNTGNHLLTNVVVMSPNLDLSNCVFSTTLAPNATMFCQIAAVEQCLTSTNIVTVSARSAQTGASVSASNAAVVAVLPIAVACGMRLFSPIDQDLSSPNIVIINEGPTPISYSVSVTNIGALPILVELRDPVLESLGCPNLPSIISLLPGEIRTVDLCTPNLLCYSTAFTNVLTATARLNPALNYLCGTDKQGLAITASGHCIGGVFCFRCGGSFVSSPSLVSSCGTGLTLSRGAPNVSSGTSASQDGPAFLSNCGLFGGTASWFELLLEGQYEGIATISTEGSDYDTYLAIYKGPITSLQYVDCSDDISRSNLNSRISFKTIAPCCTQYWLAVDGRGIIGNLKLAYGYEPRLDVLRTNGVIKVQSAPAPPLPYELQATTNLPNTAANWSSVLLTNFAPFSSSLDFTQTNAASFPQRFYRMISGSR